MGQSGLRTIREVGGQGGGGEGKERKINVFLFDSSFPTPKWRLSKRTKMSSPQVQSANKPSLQYGYSPCYKHYPFEEQANPIHVIYNLL